MAGMTPLGAVARGMLSARPKTLAMDALLYLRYRRGGGEERFAPWESAASVRDWKDAPAPAQVGRRVVEGLFQRELDPRWARTANNATHWATGVLAGAQYGLVVGSVARPRIGYGVPLGAGLWGTGYAVLPAEPLPADHLVRPGQPGQGSGRPSALRPDDRRRLHRPRARALSCP